MLRKFPLSYCKLLYEVRFTSVRKSVWTRINYISHSTPRQLRHPLPSLSLISCLRLALWLCFLCLGLACRLPPVSSLMKISPAWTHPAVSFASCCQSATSIPSVSRTPLSTRFWCTARPWCWTLFPWTLTISSLSPVCSRLPAVLPEWFLNSKPAEHWHSLSFTRTRCPYSFYAHKFMVANNFTRRPKSCAPRPPGCLYTRRSLFSKFRVFLKDF